MIVNFEPKSILEHIEHPPATWENLFRKSEDEIRHAVRASEKYCEENDLEMYPDKATIFRALDMTPLGLVKVVIFGQDPYYTTYVDPKGVTRPTATGLAFSVNKGCKTPPSLLNIYKEIKRTVEGFEIPDHGCLDDWAKQGVLLLNASLTVAKGVPRSHSEAWAGFISLAIEEIVEENPHCCFVLWGKDAKELRKDIPSKTLILESGHPSPLSVRFFKGNNHFNQINDWLYEHDKRRICWSL